jgi:hypothetical protein
LNQKVLFYDYCIPMEDCLEIKNAKSPAKKRQVVERILGQYTDQDKISHDGEGTAEMPMEHEGTKEEGAGNPLQAIVDSVTGFVGGLTGAKLLAERQGRGEGGKPATGEAVQQVEVEIAAGQGVPALDMLGDPRLLDPLVAAAAPDGGVTGEMLLLPEEPALGLTVGSSLAAQEGGAVGTREEERLESPETAPFGSV